MKFVFYRSVVLTLAVFSAVMAHHAQTEKQPSPGHMFDGEILKFDGKLNKILRGISVAELTFTTTELPNAKQIIIRSEAVSKGTLLKLFRYSFLQQYESLIDLSTFRIIKTTKHDVQKERVRDSEALFDYGAKRVTYIETDPKDRTRAPRRIASAIGDQMYDMVSAIYAVRMLPLSVGKRLEFQISDSGLVFKVPILITAREQQNTIFGKVWCFRVEPQIFGDGMLIEQKGKMVVWMTDDARRVPVRTQVNSAYGTIDIKLKSDIHPK